MSLSVFQCLEGISWSHLPCYHTFSVSFVFYLFFVFIILACMNKNQKQRSFKTVVKKKPLELRLLKVSTRIDKNIRRKKKAETTKRSCIDSPHLTSPVNTISRICQVESGGVMESSTWDVCLNVSRYKSKFSKQIFFDNYTNLIFFSENLEIWTGI